MLINLQVDEEKGELALLILHLFCIVGGIGEVSS